MKRKILAFFSSKYRLLQTSSNTLLGSTSFRSNYSASSKINSSTPKKLLKTQGFEKKTLLFQLKTLKAIFLVYRIGQISRNKLYGFKRFFDFYCARYKIIFLRPKRSIETTFQKKAIVSVQKNFWPFFPQTTVYCGLRVTFYWAPKAFEHLWCKF